MKPRLACTIGAIVLTACAHKPADATPDGAVRELLDRVERMETDPTAARAVFDLLSSTTRANLTERARRATSTSGRDVPPPEMLAPGRFSLRFEPHRMHARIAESRAIVDVVGIDPDTDRAEVPCVLEDGGWKIEIALPPLPPVERRPEAG
jgi:hypothetical protein